MQIIKTPPETIPSCTTCLTLGTHPLIIADVIAVARALERVYPLPSDVMARVTETAVWVTTTAQQIEDAPDNASPIYGINTGFGSQAGRATFKSVDLTHQLSRNLIMSHSAGAGEYLDPDIVRAAMLIRANSLAQGYSGVRPILIQKLIDMLNADIYPAIPEMGSLGASGDLAPLSHLALVISAPMPNETSGDTGEVFVPCQQPSASQTLHLTSDHISQTQTLWQKVSAKEGLTAVNGQLTLQAKEGLALINGTTFSTAIATLAVADAQNLLDHAVLALSLSLEGTRGFRDSFLPHLHEARGHTGAINIAQQVRRLTEGSSLLDGDIYTNPRRVPPQDPYSLRCAPQVLGSIADTLEFVTRTVTTEINAVTDNPLIFLDLPRSYKTVSGGNFHGEPIAMSMDFLKIAMTELGSISERRVFKLTDYDPQNQEAHGLPPFLIQQPDETAGLQSGLMIAQYTAASLVSDCKTLAHPDSVDSIPSSANREDHVSMSMNAARHARQIIRNVEQIIAIELICAAQAIDLQLQKGNGTLGEKTKQAYDLIRQQIPYLDKDRVLSGDIQTAVRLIRQKTLLNN